MTNPSRLIFCCPTCGNRFPENLDDLLVDLVSGSDHQVPGALKLIYQERILRIERKVNSELAGCVDPTCTCDQAKVFYQTFNLPFPQGNRGPQGAGIGGNPEPQEATEHCCHNLSQPTCVCTQDISCCGSLGGGQDSRDSSRTDTPTFCSFCWGTDCGRGCYG